MAAFLRWTGMIDDAPTAVTVIERLLGRQLGPLGRELVGARARDPRGEVRRVRAEGSDRIELRGLRLTVLVGVLPEERERPQPVEVDLDIDVDTTAAGASDDLADAVDYGAVVTEVERVLAAGHVQLLERQAAIVADAVLGLDERITAVRVTVRKLRPPGAPGPGDGGCHASDAERS